MNSANTINAGVKIARFENLKMTMDEYLKSYELTIDHIKKEISKIKCSKKKKEKIEYLKHDIINLEGRIELIKLLKLNT